MNNICIFCKKIFNFLHLIIVCIILIFLIWIFKQCFDGLCFLYSAFKIFGFADNILAFLLTTNYGFDDGYQYWFLDQRFYDENPSFMKRIDLLVYIKLHWAELNPLHLTYKQFNNVYITTYLGYISTCSMIPNLMLTQPLLEALKIGEIDGTYTINYLQNYYKNIFEFYSSFYIVQFFIKNYFQFIFSFLIYIFIYLFSCNFSTKFSKKK